MKRPWIDHAKCRVRATAHALQQTHFGLCTYFDVVSQHLAPRSTGLSGLRSRGLAPEAAVAKGTYTELRTSVLLAVGPGTYEFPRVSLQFVFATYKPTGNIRLSLMACDP